MKSALPLETYGVPKCVCVCLLSFQIFNLWKAVDDRKKITDLVSEVLFFRGHFLSCCPSFMLAFVFLDISYVRHSFFIFIKTLKRVFHISSHISRKQSG